MPNPSEERLTTKMTPDQLLGLHREARAKTATLSPEIQIIDPELDAVVAAIGTQESVPIVVEAVVVVPRRSEPPRPPVFPIAPRDHRATVAALVVTAVAIAAVVVALLT